MAGSFLRQRMQQLRLREQAPFPSEVRDGHELVRRWRFEQRVKLVRPHRSYDLGDRDGADLPEDTGGLD